MTSSKKYIFLSLDANMMTLFHFLRSQGGMKSYLQLMLFPTII